MSAPTPSSSRVIKGRSSCQICRARKTRCELPDPDSTPLSVPLPLEQKCHRCKTLSLSCIVEKPEPGRKPGPKKRRITPEESPEDFDLGPNLVATFEPDPWGVKSSLDTTPVISPGPIDPSDDIAIQYHGRSLELTATRLRRAFKEDETFAYSSKRLDLLQFRQRALDACFQQLLTFQPHLDSLDVMLSEYTSSPTIDIILLLALVLYICIPERDSRKPLLPFIEFQRRQFLEQLPCTKRSMQVLHLLHLVAPFGSLPHQNVASPMVARGYMVIASQLAVRLGLDRSSLSSDIWLWLGQIANLWEEAMEDGRILPVSDLDGVVSTVSTLMSEEMWGINLETDFTRTVGRLYLCDQLLRYNIIFNALRGFRSVSSRRMQSSSSGPTVSDELEGAESALEVLGKRVTAIISNHRPLLKEIANSRLLYRDIEHAYAMHLILRKALLTICALEVLKHPELSRPIPRRSDSNVAEIMSHASQPNTIIELTRRLRSSTNITGMYEITMQRGACLEQLLASFASFGSDVFPLHRATAFAFEACHVMMYTQSASLAIDEEYAANLKDTRIPIWTFMMKQAADKMAALESGRTLGGMCSKLTHTIHGVVERRMEAACIPRTVVQNDMEQLFVSDESINQFFAEILGANPFDYSSST